MELEGGMVAAVNATATVGVLLFLPCYHHENHGSCIRNDESETTKLTHRNHYSSVEIHAPL